MIFFLIKRFNNISNRFKPYTKTIFQHYTKSALSIVLNSCHRHQNGANIMEAFFFVCGTFFELALLIGKFFVGAHGQQGIP